MENFKEILKAKKMKATPIRMELLRVFHENDFALSHTELEELMQEEGDRVTIYRSINAFEEKGIIHKAASENGAAKYALCASSCTESHHHDDHVHFTCKICQKTFCWYDAKIPNISVPAGYQMDSLKVLLSGICKDCNK